MNGGVRVTVREPVDATRTVLLLHGFGATGTAHFPSDGIPARLADNGYRVVIADLLAHGASRGAHDVITVGDQIAGIRRSLMARDLAPDAIVGYSLGARIAWELLDDTRITRAVLGGLPPFEPFAGLDVDELEAAVAEPESAAMTPFASIAAVVRAAGDDGSELLAVIRGLKADPFEPTPSSSTADVLLVAGDEDPMAAPEALAECFRTARALRIPGDHAGTVTSPAFADAVVAHLTGPRRWE